MAQISLLLDEDVRPLLAEILRQRGYEAVHVLDLERTGKTDAEQLDYAASSNAPFSRTTFAISSALIEIIGPAVRSILASYFPTN